MPERARHWRQQGDHVRRASGSLDEPSASASRSSRPTWTRETENRRASSEIETRTGLDGGMVSSGSAAMTRLNNIIRPALRSANTRSSGANWSRRTPGIVIHPSAHQGAEEIVPVERGARRGSFGQHQRDRAEHGAPALPQQFGQQLGRREQLEAAVTGRSRRDIAEQARSDSIARARPGLHTSCSTHSDFRLCAVNPDVGSPGRREACK